MSTSTFAVDQNDPRNDPTLDTLVIPYEPRSAWSKNLFGLAEEFAADPDKHSQLHKMARNHDTCQRRRRDLSCVDHRDEDLGRELFTCQYRFTNCCHSSITDRRMDKWDDFIHAVMQDAGKGDVPGYLALIHVSIPCKKTRKDADRVYDRFNEQLYRQAEKWNEGGGDKESDENVEDETYYENTPYFVMPCFQGWYDSRGGRASIKVIYLGARVSNTRIREDLATDGAIIRVGIHAPSQAPQVFREAFEIMVPKDEAEQAEIEWEMRGFHLIRQSDGNEFDEIITGIEHWITVNKSGDEVSAEHNPQLCDGCPDDEHKKPRRVCSRCGKPPTIISEWYSVDATPEEMAKLKWYRIPPPPG